MELARIRSPLLGAAATLFTAIALLAGPATAVASTPYTDINSAGPLTDVYIGNDLGCQIAHTGDTDFETYPPDGIPGDCGTILATGGQLYTPDFVNHSASTATGFSGTPYTPVSQSAVTGSGTGASPYQLTTVVDAGSTGLRLTETDSYVVGSESYNTSVTVSNSTASAQTALLYRGADCFLQGSDSGYGFVDPVTHGPACTINQNNSPPGPIEEFVPVTAGAHYVETFYGTVWGDIAAETDLPDTCDCSTLEDNGAAVNWDLSIPANSSVTYSSVQLFSSSGNLALTTTKTADSSTAASGGTDGYTITISNPNASAVTLTDITDTLPAGFTYTAGSTTGATTADPTVSGQNLTWTGAFSVPATGTLSLHFNVTVATSPNTYYNSAGGDSSSFTVAGTGPTAPVTVQGGGGGGGGGPGPVLIAPVVQSSCAAGPVSANGAHLSGIVNPEGLQTTAHFDYGLSTAYGSSTPDQALPGDDQDHTVTANISGLAAHTTYHCRLVATNAIGTTLGADQTFTTSSGSGGGHRLAAGLRFRHLSATPVHSGCVAELARSRSSRHHRQPDCKEVVITLSGVIDARASGERLAVGLRHDGNTLTASRRFHGGSWSIGVTVPADSREAREAWSFSIFYPGDQRLLPGTVTGGFRLEAESSGADKAEHHRRHGHHHGH